MTEEFSQYYQKFSEELTRTVLLESKGAIASLAAFEGRADDSKYIIGKIAGRPGEKKFGR